MANSSSVPHPTIHRNMVEHQRIQRGFVVCPCGIDFCKRIIYRGKNSHSGAVQNVESPGLFEQRFEVRQPGITANEISYGLLARRAYRAGYGSQCISRLLICSV